MNFEFHYNTYTFGDASFSDVLFLVTEAMVCHNFSYEMVMVVICHYKSLLVTDYVCH